MRLELFDYDLPPERIAQNPIESRDAAHLLVARGGGTEHRAFRELPNLIQPDDLLVFNDTRVLPARLRGCKLGPGGQPGARVEALLLRRLERGRWEALVHPGRRLDVGARVRFGEGELEALVLERGPEGVRVLALTTPDGEDTDSTLHRLGEVPLPPYIHARLEDAERYQTVYAREEGSAAAPTAGLHFTPAMLADLRERGVRCAFVTLHVGIGTFRPVKTDTIEEHAMHGEWYWVPPETVAALDACRGRVVAVGTTTVRCLESWAAARAAGEPGAEGPRETRLYITPGYRFRVVEALLTNFHMPRSSLLILVSAFAGVDTVRAAYAEALAGGYRFLSFGDAMFLERTGD